MLPVRRETDGEYHELGKKVPVARRGEAWKFDRAAGVKGGAPGLELSDLDCHCRSVSPHDWRKYWGRCERALAIVLHLVEGCLLFSARPLPGLDATSAINTLTASKSGHVLQRGRPDLGL